MPFGKSIIEIIKDRKSCRTFSKTPLSDDEKEAIKMYIEAFSSDDFRFELIDTTSNHQTSGKIGTYGFIRGAQTFVVGSIKKEITATEHFGYAFEKLVLYLTNKGLGSCWLGGTFDRKKFSARLHPTDSEFIPIVSPVGYPGKGINMINSLVRFAAKSDQRLPWEKLFFSVNFATPLTAESAGAYETPLAMVRLAPSASNKQPWRIVKDGTRFHFYLERDKSYAKIIRYDIQRNDIGIAMCHFELTALELGLKGNWIIKCPAENADSKYEYITSWYCEEL